MIEISVQQIPWPFPKKVFAVTLWPFIFYEHEVRQDKGVQVHERYHLRDQRKWLVIPWFIAYIALLPFYGGGREHPLERLAYELQDAEYIKKSKKG